MARTGRKATRVIMVSIPVAVFLMLQSLGIGAFPIISILQPEDTREPAGLLRTGLMMAQSGSNIYVAWIDASSNQDILFRAGKNAGGAFDPVINLSSSESRSYTRSIASEGSVVYVVWVDETQEDSDVFFRRSADGGKTFDPVKNLSKSTVTSEFPVIDTDGPAIYVAWLDSTPANDEIFFRASQDAGATFGEALNISSSAGNSESPAIAAEGSNVYVAWHDYDDSQGKFDVIFRASHDSGMTFGPAINLSSNDGNSGFAVLASSGSDVYVAWIDESPGQQDILFRASRDGGMAFGPTINLSKSEAKSRFPVIDADGPLVGVGWIDETQEGEKMLFTRSTDGLRFSEPTSIASSKDLGAYVIEMEGVDLYVAWIEKNAEIDRMFLRESSNAGSSFGPPMNIALGRIDDAGVLAEGTNVYAVWSDKKCSDDHDLGEECASIAVNAYFKQSGDRGSTFGTPVRLNE